MGNLASPTVTVVAITSLLTGRRYPFQVRVPVSARTGLVSESLINCAQFTTISKNRLERRIGALPPDLMRAVDTALRVALGLR